MYKLGNIYYVDFQKKDYPLGLVMAGVAFTSMMYIGMYVLPTKNVGMLEKTVLKLYVKRDKNAVDFSTKVI